MPPREIAYVHIASLVGQEVGVSDWLEISQERVNRFADATGDHQWIHVDVERATREIGAPIAHGYLTLSLIAGLAPQIMTVSGVARGINYGADKVRFTSTVPVGAHVRLRQEMLAAEPKAGGLQVRNRCTMEIKGQERPACVAETLSVLYPAE